MPNAGAAPADRSSCASERCRHPRGAWYAFAIEALQSIRLKAYPAAHAMRPQLGSCPYTAAFTKDDATTDFEIFLASSSLAAPDVCTSIKQVAPSPSHAIDFARPCRALADLASVWVTCPCSK